MRVTTVTINMDFTEENLGNVMARICRALEMAGEEVTPQNVARFMGSLPSDKDVYSRPNSQRDLYALLCLSRMEGDGAAVDEVLRFFIERMTGISDATWDLVKESIVGVMSAYAKHQPAKERQP